MQQEFYTPGDPVADILFNWFPVIGTIVLGIVGVYLILLGYHRFLNSAYLKRAGVPARATVTEKWIKKGYVNREERHRTSPIKHYFLRYQILDDPREFSTKEIAPVDLWESTEVGDTVDVIAHPKRRLMRLAAWKNYRGKDAGVVQMAMGAIALSSALAMMALGAFEAIRAPEQKVRGSDWLRDQAEVLQMGTPANPYLRIFSPGSKMIRVVFGDTHGGAFVANQRVIRVSAEQIATYEVSQGAVLTAWIDPANEYNAILDLERANY